jgi:hypothetical protein
MENIEKVITKILQIFNRSHEPCEKDNFTSLEIYRVKIIDAINEYGKLMYKLGKGVDEYSPVPSYMKHGVNFLNSQIAKKEQDEK